VAASARISLTDSSRVRQPLGRARPYRRSQRTTADSGSSSQIVKTSGSQVSTSMAGSVSRNRWVAYRWTNSNRPAAMLRATVWSAGSNRRISTAGRGASSGGPNGAGSGQPPAGRTGS